MSVFIQKFKSMVNPLKKRFVWIRNELTGAMDAQTKVICSEICESIRNITAYSVVRDLNIAHKEQTLLMFYPVWNNRANFMVTNKFDMVKKYLNSVRPIQMENLVRIGGANDGGYIMINPKIDLLKFVQDSSHNSPPQYLLDNPPLINFTQNPPKALSLGVSPYSPWDLDMANFGYKVLQYDASIAHAPYNHPNITFHKKFVGARDSHDTISFELLLAQNDFSPNACNVLQCDIEDCEWEILENIDLAKIARYFPQVIFEFHKLFLENTFADKRLAVLEKLKAYYTPIHAHFNNWGGAVWYSNGYFWCQTVEVSYLRNDLIKESNLIVGSGYLHCDAPNVKEYPDIPIIFDDFV